jgi:hypothetical protein
VNTSRKEMRMLISDLGGRLGLDCLQESYEDRPLSSGYCSDLLSDVMANAAAGCVLVTIQAHKNSVAVAVLVGAAALVLCNGRLPPPDMLEAARTEGLAIFATTLSQFEVSGRLWVRLAPAGALDDGQPSPRS